MHRASYFQTIFVIQELAEILLLISSKLSWSSLGEQKIDDFKKNNASARNPYASQPAFSQSSSPAELHVKDIQIQGNQLIPSGRFCAF